MSLALFSQPLSQMPRYQDVYPSAPLLDSTGKSNDSAAEILTLEYFEADPGEMPTQIFEQHHILLNLKEEIHRVENWRDGEHLDFQYHQHEIIVTPAGMESGWRWHAKSKVIVITLDPKRFHHFAQNEVGILLSENQLADIPVFADPDICQAGVMLMQAVEDTAQGSVLMYESLARVFLVKLIQKYGLQDEDYQFSKSFTSKHYGKVLAYVHDHFSESILVEDLAGKAGLSTSHFAHLFKQTIGMSPMQFVMDYRLERAKRRLSEKTTPLLDIALSCGFSDQAHFTRSFKQLHGEIPSSYRQRISDQP